MLKNNWRTVRLSEICSIATGKWDANHATQNGKYKFFTCAKEPFYCDTFKFSGECLILPGNGVNVGEVFYYNGDFDAYQRTYVLKHIKAEARFLHYHFLLYWKERNLSKQFGSATNFIKMENFLNYEVFLPSIDEQKRIVGILDEVFEGVAKAKENVEGNLRNVSEVFEAYLQSVFASQNADWKEEFIENVIKKTETVDPTKNPNKKFIYLDVSSVNKESLEIENAAIIDGRDAPSRARKLIKTNDIIFATIRPTLGRVAMITENYNEQVCSTGYFVLRAKESLNHKLLFYYLLTNGFKNQMEKLQRGASYPAVSDADVKNQIINFPKSLSEQKSIVTKLDALSTETKKLEAIYKEKLNHLEELKKSILKKAFNGEL